MSNGVLVFDTSPLVHFSRADELKALRLIVAGFECVTTKAVLGELRRGVDRHPAIWQVMDLDWIEIVPCDELEELYLFGQYMNRLGNLERNAGEASVLAWPNLTRPRRTSTIRLRAISAGLAAFESIARCNLSLRRAGSVR